MKLSKEITRIGKLNKYTRPDKVSGAIKMDSNENFALDKEFIASVTAQVAGRVDLREYPLDELDYLYFQLSKYTGISEKCIGVGSGSDQIIELILTTLVSKGCRATVFTPTFSYFMNRCELHGIKVDKVPLDRNFEVDAKAFLKSARKSDLVYICSPNNPTGNQVGRKALIEMIDSLGDSLVLIDEAYSDFSPYSLSNDASKRSNVIVLRTLSKAFGLAGARVGYMIANERTAKVFKSTIQSPYPVSTLSLSIATNVLANSHRVIETIKVIRGECKRVSARLAADKDIRVFRSDANFIFIETGKKYGSILRALKKEGIIVKLLGNVAGHRGCMRVTIGTAEMNDLFLRCIDRAVEA